ncbi:hypothetical protein [Lactobacillus sp.]|uniref:hypothetical protein n=1 Tax=Lactobacillus sp. TaxID=1591 RepID=UPI00199731DA|nr:hypothetical protein [Lactobacillus sp.]MBD5430448.1 hypothetical protein [Lactobacillus sp.]
MKKTFKFLTLLALIAPVTTACSNNSTSSNSTAESSTSSKSSAKKSNEVTSSIQSSESSSSSSEISSDESSSSSSSQETQSSSNEDSSSEEKSSNEEKSSSATSNSTSDDTTSKMNLAQIKDGNFSSLKGNWELVKAVAAHKDITDTTHDGLNVEKTGFASLSINMTADGIADSTNNKTYPVKYISRGDSLTATLTDEAASNTAINWSVSFYPAGSKNFTVDGEKQDPPTKNTIVIWTSNNNLSEVFQEK